MLSWQTGQLERAVCDSQFTQGIGYPAQLKQCEVFEEEICQWVPAMGPLQSFY